MILLGIGAAHGASAPNKPYKVCPTVPQTKDYPCVAMRPTASIVTRYEAIPEDNKEKELRTIIAMQESELKALKYEIEMLHQMLRDLMDREIKRQTDVIIPNQDEK